MFFRIYVDGETHFCDMVLDELAIRRIINEIFDEKLKTNRTDIQSLDFIGKEYEDLKNKVIIMEETNKNLDQ